MARKYSRDNRGRFASVGATARGGRLRTAAGNKRETVTTTGPKRATPSGAIRRKDVVTARTQNGISKNIEARNKAGLNGAKPRSAENQSTRLARAEKRIAQRQPKPVANSAAAKPAAAKPGSIKGARLGGTRQTTRAAAPRNTTPNRTGQSKTLNRFNSRPIGTMVAGKGDKLVPSTKRVPLNINLKESDLAFARIATKASRARAAAPAKAEAKQITANQASRAAANQKRVTQAVLAKGGRRPTPTKKQRRSIMTAEAAKRFYATRAVDTLKVNVKKPGFRLPR